MRLRHLYHLLRGAAADNKRVAKKYQRVVVDLRLQDGVAKPLLLLLVDEADVGLPFKILSNQLLALGDDNHNLVCARRSRLVDN